MNKLAQMASTLQSIGAAGSNDSVLAHITPREAAMLKARGGSGKRDPNTGLPHFDDGSDSGDSVDNSSTNTPGSYNGYAGVNNMGSSLNGNSYGSSSTYNGTPGSWNNYSGVNIGSDPGYGYSNPAVDSKGYYSSDNGDSGGSDYAHYYADRRTLGGDIANKFGYDPEGFMSKLINGGMAVAGAVNPGIGMINKVAQAAIGAQSDPHQIDAEGNGGTLNFAGRLLGNNKLANALGMTLNPDNKRSEEESYNRDGQSSYSSSPSSTTSNSITKKKKAPGAVPDAVNDDWLYAKFS